MPRMGLPERLRKAMGDKGINGAELARRLDLERQAIYNWLAGRAEPTQQNLRNLATILDVEQEWLSSGRKAKPDITLGLQLHGDVAAGVWIEVHENQDMEYRRVAVAPDPNYPTDAQYALTAALEDVEVDLAESSGVEDVLAALEHLVDACGPLAGLQVRPVTDR